jgi:hypothetical protein
MALHDRDTTIIQLADNFDEVYAQGVALVAKLEDVDDIDVIRERVRSYLELHGETVNSPKSNPLRLEFFEQIPFIDDKAVILSRLSRLLVGSELFANSLKAISAQAVASFSQIF